MRSLRRLIAILLLPSYVWGCTGWQPQTVPAPELLAQRPVQELRVHLVDGTSITFRNPRIANDSLVGYAPSATPEDAFATPDVRAIPLDRIARVDIREPAANRTGLLIGGMAAWMTLALPRDLPVTGGLWRWAGRMRAGQYVTADASLP